MSFRPLIITLVCSLGLLSAGTATFAQSVNSDANASVDVHVGTLGIGAEVGKQFSPNLAARVGYNGFNYNYNVTPQSIKYEGQLKLSTVTALLDYFPARQGSFHITGGYVNDSNQVTGNATSTGTLTVNGTTYSEADLGSVAAKVQFPSSSYYLGIGWGKPSESGSRVRVLFDIGALFQGTPSVNLTPTYGAAANADPAIKAQIQNDINAEENTYKGDFNDIKIYPVVQIGLAVHI